MLITSQIVITIKVLILRHFT